MSDEQHAIEVRHNEKGSVSIRGLCGDWADLMIVKQTRLGDVEARFEINLGPNEALHVIAQPRPVPQDPDPGPLRWNESVG